MGGKQKGELIDSYQNKNKKDDRMKRLLIEAKNAGKNFKHKNVVDLVDTLIGR